MTAVRLGADGLMARWGPRSRDWAGAMRLSGLESRFHESGGAMMTGPSGNSDRTRTTTSLITVGSRPQAFAPFPPGKCSVRIVHRPGIRREKGGTG
jgi:hypothetical protein